VVWTDEDRDIVMAWQVEQALICSGCGHPIDESHDPANEGHYEAEMLRCHACKAKGSAAHDFLEAQENKPHGAKWRVRLRR
jgi:hypothetical protein